MNKVFELFSKNESVVGNLYCPVCGRKMAYPHDDAYTGTYDITTGKRKKYFRKVKTRTLQYCMKDDIFAYIDTKGEWKTAHDLMNVLHIIA